MKPLKISLLCLLGAVQTQAAVSIRVEPGPSGSSIFTVTESAPNPLLNISNTSGYVLGMDLPTSMFNIPGLGGGYSSDIQGNLISSLATIREVFTNQTFLLDRLRIPADSSPSTLYFDPIYLTGVGAASARFSVESQGPVVTNIGFQALNIGTHSLSSPIFGTVTVTVIPEPAEIALFVIAAIPIVARRRR